MVSLRGAASRGTQSCLRGRTSAGVLAAHVAAGRLLAGRRAGDLLDQALVRVVVAGRVLQRGGPVAGSDRGLATARSLRAIGGGLLQQVDAGATACVLRPARLLRRLLVGALLRSRLRVRVAVLLRLGLLAGGLLRLRLAVARLLQHALLRGGLGMRSDLLRLLGTLLCGVVAAGPCRRHVVAPCVEGW